MKIKQLMGSLLFSLMAVFSLAAQATISPTMSVAGEAPPAVSVNINTADADTLQQMLSGIGTSKAQAIVAYREEHGDFIAVDELLEVKGIGQSILNNNLEKLSIE